MTEVKKKRGRKKKEKIILVNQEETKILTFIPEPVPEVIIEPEIMLSTATKVESVNEIAKITGFEIPKIIIPDFKSLKEFIIYVKLNENTNFLNENCTDIISSLTKIIDDIIEKNVGYHLSKFTRCKIENLSQEVKNDYLFRLRYFNLYTFIDEYLIAVKHCDCFKCYRDDLKQHYEKQRLKTEHISKSDKVIMYKYYL